MRGTPDKTLGDEEAAARGAEAVDPRPSLDVSLDVPLDVLDLAESHIIEPVEPPRPPQGADSIAEALQAPEPAPARPASGGSAPPLDTPSGGSTQPLDMPAAEAPPLRRAVEPRARPTPPVGRAYGGFWERLIAWVVDVTLLLLVFMVMAAGALLVVGGPGAFIDPASASAGFASLGGLFGLFEILIVGAYHVFFVAAAGATPGKAVLGLKVVRADGTPVGAGHAFLRFAGYFLELIPGGILAGVVGGLMTLSMAFFLSQPLLGLAFGTIASFLTVLGYLWIAFDPRKQAWHDKLAGTVVVKP